MYNYEDLGGPNVLGKLTKLSLRMWIKATVITTPPNYWEGLFLLTDNP